MIAVSPGVRALLATRPVDFRTGWRRWRRRCWTAALPTTRHFCSPTTRRNRLGCFRSRRLALSPQPNPDRRGGWQLHCPLSRWWAAGNLLASVYMGRYGNDHRAGGVAAGDAGDAEGGVARAWLQSRICPRVGGKSGMTEEEINELLQQFPEMRELVAQIALKLTWKP